MSCFSIPDRCVPGRCRHVPGYAVAAVGDDVVMRPLLGFRGWHGVLSVVVAAGVGATTNLVTGGFSWALADGLVERIVAAGDPTLVIVDDADRKSGLDVLIARAVRHPELVRTGSSWAGLSPG